MPKGVYPHKIRFKGCAVEGCDRPHLARALCSRHWQQWKSGKLDYTPPDLHVPQHKKYVMKRQPARGFLTPQGYRAFLVGGRYGKQMKEHRIVMERALGRPLTPDETVHHIDGDKLNNHISNLQILSRSEHTRLHNLMRAGKI